jgi:hypothetical protein
MVRSLLRRKNRDAAAKFRRPVDPSGALVFLVRAANHLKHLPFTSLHAQGKPR